VPGMVAVVAPLIMVRQLSVVSILGVLFAVPGIVLMVRKKVK